jgi:septal ring factor EnvC (AmiA/AmiB activator)
VISGIRPTLRTAALLALACLSTHAYTAPKPELQELRGRIDSLKKSLDSKEDAKADAADELKISEQAISGINSALRDLTRQQQAAQSTLSSLEQEKASVDKRIEAEQGMLGRLIYQQYLSGQQDQFKILLNQEDPSQAMRQLRYYTYLARARGELLERLRGNLAKLEQLALATETKQAELTQIRAEQDKQRQKLVAQQQTKKKLVTQLSKQIGQQRSELARLQRNERQLTQLIERLARQQKATSRKTPTPSSAARNLAVPDASFAGTSFPQLKGKLKLPVRGELTGRFGTPRQDSGSPWRGLFIRTAAAQEVHTIASGRVVFADWLRGFGNLLIVDHGGGYMSLYGNNESIFKRTGEEVRAGDVIASTGNSGGNAETGLYFEIRYQSKPFDPLDWCKIS